MTKMRMKSSLYSILFSILFFLLFTEIKGQNSQLVTKSLCLDKLLVQVDSMPIIPETFVLKEISPENFQLNWINGTILVKDSSLLGKIVFCSYRTFSMAIPQVSYRKSRDIIMRKSATYKPKIIDIQPFNFLSESNGNDLLSTGSISRGFTVGSNQNFSVNSTLNLQLSGYLAKDLEIKANITDNNVPMQAEGNTRVIQDFNQVFISLNYKNQWLLDAGDVEILNPESYFMVLGKQFLGLKFSANNTFNNKYRLKNKIGGGMAKGKYVREKLNLVNGMQGPYQLSGAQSSGTIVILSGSESVYLDNQLLTRGADEDYVMDYNSGEITFTSKILITTEKEINIEYEYSDLAYSRVSLFSFNEFEKIDNPKFKLFLHYFHEQDLQNRSIQPELDNSMKLFLSQLESGKDAYYLNADTASYSTNEILYVRKDTVVDGQNFSSIYCYSNDSQEKLYRLGFSFVGENKGNYILSVSTANGRIFQWIAPMNGIPQGNYEPVVLLTTPELTQMGTVGGSYLFSEKTGVNAEFALSNYNDNTFAPSNSKLGYSFNFNAFHKNNLHSKKKSREQWLFETQIIYEFLNRNFHPIESYRNVEFYKDYNLSENYSGLNDEQMLQFKAGFAHKEIGKSTYSMNYYSRFNELQAIKNEFVSSTTLNKFLFSTQTSLLNTKDSLYHTLYFRTYNTFSKTFKKIETGIYERFEINRYTNNFSDTLVDNSFLYNEAHLYLTNNDSTRNKFMILYKNIIHQSPNYQNLITDERSNEAQVSFEITQIKNSRFKGTATYRNTQVWDTARQSAFDNYFIGKVEYSGRYLKNSLVFNTYYEAGSGLEQKKIYSFLKVLDGQGSYIWNDYNNNGIEELNEFEIASFQDEANYSKIWISSFEYINTYNNQFTQIVQWRPANLWSRKTGFLKFISRFSDAASLRISQKNRLAKLGDAINPFLFNIPDSSIVQSTVNFNNNLSFNQSSKYWGMDYIYRNVRNVLLAYYGLEINHIQVHQMVTRIKPAQNVTLKIDYALSDNLVKSEYFLSDNYHIRNHKINTSWLVQHTFPINWKLEYEFSHKKNILDVEMCQIHTLIGDISYRIANRGVVNANIQFTHIQYNAISSTNIGYEMLEGLKVGGNLIWNLSFQTKISEYLQLNFRYEGRASQNSDVIHTGIVQIKALF